MSLMHLLTVGGASNARAPSPRSARTTLAELRRDLVEARLAARVDAPARRRRHQGSGVAAVARQAPRRPQRLRCAEAPRRRFVLYLRPFDTDDVVLPTPKLPPWSRLFSYRPLAVRVEEELFDVADGHLPLIAVGKPGTQDATEGGVAYRAFLADSEWQGYVADKIRRAERIVLVMKASAGVRWEIERVVAEGAAPKTLFLFDPALADAERAELEHTLAPVLQGLEGRDAAVDARAIGFWFRGATRVEVVNANRSATSYRTAFSTFLADPAVAASPTTVAA
jgi:hypothetical protein